MNSVPAEGLGRDNDDAIRSAVKTILDLLDEAMAMPSNQLKGEVEAVESRLVELRDQLIIAQRRAETASQSPALVTINTALSLVVSIEYPAAGIHREALVEAHSLLKGYFAA